MVGDEIADNTSRPRITRQLKDHDSELEEDGVIEMGVKSRETVIREKYNRALADGKVMSLVSTFNSISATVTSMRDGASSSRRPKEREIEIRENSAMISYEAKRMVMVGDDKFSVAAKEGPNGRRIAVSMHPFAQGGLRNVYQMTQISKRKQTRYQVAKESRHDIKYQERLKFHLETAKCQSRAAIYAKSFNKNTRCLDDVPDINVLSVEVYRLNAPSCPGGFRYLSVENKLKGVYEKWNNNDGYVHASDCMNSQVAQAFRYSILLFVDNARLDRTILLMIETF